MPAPRPTNSSWLNRIEAQFTALRYFALDGTDHTRHKNKAASSAATSSGETATLTTSGYEPWSTGRTLPDAALVWRARPDPVGRDGHTHHP
ncbi:hypothetical protein GCM10027074_01220 [Streptomyces deserti]